VGGFQWGLVGLITAQAAARVGVAGTSLASQETKALGGWTADQPSCFERGASERRPALRMLSCPDLPRP